MGWRARRPPGTFDVDRAKELWGTPRPVRPGEIARVRRGGPEDIDRVVVDGINADYKVAGADLLVTVPAFARRGDVELLLQSGGTRSTRIELAGAEPPQSVGLGHGCTGEPGCVQVMLEPRVGSVWLKTIASVVDADIARHNEAGGLVELKLRLPSTHDYARQVLRTMPGVVSVR
jgi:hypothetical protein